MRHLLYGCLLLAGCAHVPVSPAAICSHLGGRPAGRFASGAPGRACVVPEVGIYLLPGRPHVEGPASSKATRRLCRAFEDFDGGQLGSVSPCGDLLVYTRPSVGCPPGAR